MNGCIVIYDLDPAEEGWIPLGKRLWQKPDGTLFEFPPGAPQMLKRMERVASGQVVMIPRKNL